MSSLPQPDSILPVGGTMLDGVYHPTGEAREWRPYPFTTLRGCADAAPKAATSTSSTLRMSVKV